MRLIKKAGLLLLSTICMIQTVWVGGQDGGIEAEAREKYFSRYAIEEEAIAPVSGESYYQYQWALKNSGTLRRISSANRLGQGEGAYGPGINLAAGEQITTGVAGVDIGIEDAWTVYEQTTERRAVTID